MTTTSLPSLCNIDGCRRLAGHLGKHSLCPTEAWDFFSLKDKQKLVKAGFATPRGGRKGAYQNHVVRSNKVIIPYERLQTVDLNQFKEGYVIRVLPEQYFGAPGMPKPEFIIEDSTVKVGENAFVLYRTRQSYTDLPPLTTWELRRLEKDGNEVTERGPGVIDIGHYVLRISGHGRNPGEDKGPPQGLFAPEYADLDANYLCKCVLAWLVIHTIDSPYTTSQAGHLCAILDKEGLHDMNRYEFQGSLRHGLCACPLCSRFIQYDELHDVISFEEAAGLANAPEQVLGATRSTIVNLFHLEPLAYDSLNHMPRNVAWGHAICNTQLGQRRCFSLAELQAMNLKVGIIHPEGIETFGWISDDSRMIRSPRGAVWIQLSSDYEEELPVDGEEISEDET